MNISTRNEQYCLDNQDSILRRTFTHIYIITRADHRALQDQSPSKSEFCDCIISEKLTSLSPQIPTIRPSGGLPPQFSIHNNGGRECQSYLS